MPATIDAAARWAVYALCAAQFLLILDAVVITVAVPSIRADLGLADSRVQLTGTAYTVTFGSLLIVAGRAGDLLGRRPLLLGGLALFVTASVGAAAAQADWQLFAARGLQGVGAAMVSANALAAITTALAEGPARAWALGIWAGVGSAGAIAGQLIGGVVTDVLGWRWIFLINLPVGVVVLALLARLVPDAPPTPGTRPDVRGAVLLTGGLVAGLLALTWSGEDGARPWATVAGLTAVVLLAGFASAEERHPAPLLRFGLLRLPGVRTANVTLLLNAGALTAAMFFLTLYLQVVLGLSALAVGLAFAPITLVVLVLSPRAAALTSRYGVRPLLTGGLLLLAAGALLLTRLPADGSYVRDVLPGMLLLAVGSGLAYAPTFVAASAGVPAADQGGAAGLVGSVQELGAAAGLAVLALVATRATDGAGPAALAGGYRAGLLAATALFVIAALVAATAPRGLGRSAPAPEPLLPTRSASDEK